MTISNDPDEIRADIERTRGTLSNDVDDLAESVKPKSVARRQVDKVKDAVGSLTELGLVGAGIMIGALLLELLGGFLGGRLGARYHTRINHTT